MPGLNFKELGATVEEAAREGAALAAPAVGKAAEAAGERPADALASSGEARAELPAFLEGDELPDGYEAINLEPLEKQLIQLGQEAGSEVVVYTGNVGVRLTRTEDGEVFFRFEGLRIAENIAPFKGDSTNISLQDIGPQGIKLREGLKIRLRKIVSMKRSKDEQIRGFGFGETIYLNLPSEIQDEGGGKTEISGLDYDGIIFRSEGEGVSVKNDDRGMALNLAVPEAGVKKGRDGVEAGRDSVQQRMAGAIKELVELGKNREATNLGRRAGKAVAELLTAMGEAEPGLITKMAGAALGKENLTDKDVTMFFGRVVGTAVRMKAEITSPTSHLEETELFISLQSLLVLSKEPDSPSRQEDAGYDLGRILTNLSRVDAGIRDRLVAAGLNKKPEELTEEDMLIFFGRVVGTAVAMKAKL